MKNIEMHCHSTLSDGRNALEEIIAEAKRCNLDFLSLTDHDHISPKSFQEELQDLWIQSCDSVEISARNYELDKSLHLVSYAKVFHNSLHQVLENSRSGKLAVKLGQLEKLVTEYDFEGTLEWFQAFMWNMGRDVDTSNKYDLSRYLYSIPQNQEKMRNILWERIEWNDMVAQFYEVCFKREGALYPIYGYEVEDYEPSVQETVDEVVKKSWGLVSLAHPNVTFWEKKWGIPEFERTIWNYVAKGVRGVEINTMASPEWIQAILVVRQKYDLILTFWSDCHRIGYDGRDGKHSTIGQINSNIPQEVLDENFWKFQSILRT